MIAIINFSFHRPRPLVDLAMKLAVMLLSVVHCTPSPAQDSPRQLSAGKTQFEFIDKKGDPTRPVTVWMFVPEGCDSTCPLQFVMHGLRRNGEEYLDNWVEYAKQHRFVVLTPEFSRWHYPRDEDYSLGRSITEADPSKWAFAVLEHLFDDLKTRYGFTTETYRLFGHSAGGQFVHRFHLFQTKHRAKPIIAANPGWYTQLQWGLTSESSFKFPYNTHGSKIDDARAKQALSHPFVLMLGDRDIDAFDRSLNRSRGANAQGINRLERGKAYFENARTAATNLGVSYIWQLQVVPGVAHDNAGMAKAAIAWMLAPRRNE